MRVFFKSAVCYNTFFNCLVVWQIIQRQQRLKSMADLRESRSLFTRLVVGSLTEIHHIVDHRLPVLTLFQALMKMAFLPILDQLIHMFNHNGTG